MATPMQTCMDSSCDWLKGIVHEDGGIQSSSPSGEFISCSGPAVAAESRPLRPQHDQALKCPRCDSTHTKFCYYNNYSLSQPRYFCKTCRRYWTKGGSLRNVPVGGGCRKNKRSGAKKPAEPPRHPAAAAAYREATNLQLSFSGVQLPQLMSSPIDEMPLNFNFLECKYNPMLESSGGGAPPCAAMNHLFLGRGDIDMGDLSHGFSAGSFQLGTSSLGSAMHGSLSNAAVMEACQRLTLPYEVNDEEPKGEEVKLEDRSVLPFYWHEHCCADAGRESMGYSNGGLRSWPLYDHLK